MNKVINEQGDDLKTTKKTYERHTQLIYLDILRDVIEYGVRAYIEQGIHFQYYESYQDGINALYRKSHFFTWLTDTEKYEAAQLIKDEIQKIEYEESI